MIFPLFPKIINSVRSSPLTPMNIVRNSRQRIIMKMNGLNMVTMMKAMTITDITINADLSKRRT